jgi:peptide/nickel transport system substrate-binding protein
MMKKSACCAALLLAVLLLPLAWTQAPAEPPAARTLIYGAGLTPRGMNPLLDGVEWNEVSSAIFSRLFRPDHAGNIVGDLVERHTVSRDGLTWTLRLRRNARWHDGAPLTADDVLFTWQKLFDPATNTKMHLNQPMVASFEKAGRHAVRFRLKYADAGFLAPLTEIPILPAHLLKDKDINSGAVDKEPVGSGPYKLAGREDNRFLMERHDAYHHGRPPIARLIFVVIPGDDERARALERREIHIAQIKAQHVEALVHAGPHPFPPVRVYRMSTGAWRGMPLNLRRPALSDRRVRQALDLAIDREAIAARALGGFGAPAYSPVPPASWAFTPAMNRKRFDRQRAAALLDEAGWKKDGAWRQKDGRALELEFIVWKDEIFRRTAAEMMKEQLEPLGIRVNLHLVDNVGYNRLAGSMEDQYDTFLGGWGGLLDPGDNLGKKYATGGSQNYGGYSNPEVDELLRRARATPPAQREAARRLYAQAVELVTRDAVFLPVAYPDYVFAADARLAGLDEFICDSWYEFPKYAHEWSWRE